MSTAFVSYMIRYVQYWFINLSIFERVSTTKSLFYGLLLGVLIHSEVINLFYCVHGLSINQNLTAAFRVIWRWTGKFLFSMNISGVKEHNSEIFRIISKIYEGAFCENSQWLNRLFFVTNKIAIVDVWMDCDNACASAFDTFWKVLT